MSYYHRWPQYISAAQKRAKAQKKLQQLRKKKLDIKPVIIEGNSLVHSWWGKAWNSNLEKYADYHNRISRGRSYVRNGSVLDLQIMAGKVEALVMGTGSRPYSVIIKIKPIKKTVLKHIQKICEGKLESLQELLSGKFPKTLSEIFMAKSYGLFPSPRDIEFDCNCPDWANMCKHVAAVLYGIGVRFDKSPELFFKLRKMRMNDLITKAVHAKSKQLLKKSMRKTSRKIDDSEIAHIFNIDLEDNIKIPKSKTLKSRKKTIRNKKKTRIKKRVICK